MSITPLYRSIALPTRRIASNDRRCRRAVQATEPTASDRPPRTRLALASVHRLALATAVVATVRLFTAIATLFDRPAGRSATSRDRGQATTEYALILLAAALVGLMVVAWATAGGGAARISRLFNGVIDSVVDKV